MFAIWILLPFFSNTNLYRRTSSIAYWPFLFCVSECPRSIWNRIITPKVSAASISYIHWHHYSIISSLCTSKDLNNSIVPVHDIQKITFVTNLPLRKILTIIENDVFPDHDQPDRLIQIYWTLLSTSNN